MAITLIGDGLISYAPSPPPAIGIPSIGFNGAIPSGTDSEHGGNYQVTGTVKITPDSPTHRKVTLFDAVSRLLIREQWSDPITGAYAFTRIRAGTYFVVAVDYTHTYNAVIADNITADLMP